MKTKEWEIDYSKLVIEKRYKKSWMYFFHFYKTNPKWLWSIIFISFLAAAITISIPFLTQKLAYSRENKEMITFIVMTVVIISVDLIKITLDFITEYLGQYFNYKLETNWREIIVRKTHKLPLNFFEDRSIGSFISRIMNDLKDLTTFAFQFLSNVIFVTTISIGGFIYIFYVTWKIGLIVAAIYLLSLVIYFLFLKKLIINRQYVKVLNGNVIWEIDEHIELIQESKSYDMAKFQIDNFINFQKQYLKATKKIYYQFALYKIIGITTNALISTTILIVASYWMIEGGVVESELLGLVAAANLFVVPLITLAKLFVDSAGVTASLTRLYDWIIQDEEDNGGKLKPTIKGDIEFKNVYFSYKLKNGTQRHVLKNFNLKIQNGEIVHCHGPSACGKSTILKLIMRFYEIDSGKILINGINIKDIEINHLRKSIAFKNANPKLFSAKIKEEILFPDKERWTYILKQLGAQDIYVKKTAIDQTVNSQGIQLSNSENEILSLAQALYYENEIILIDSLDGFLDSNQIEKVKKYLKEIALNKTIIIMSSRSKNIFEAGKSIYINPEK